MTIQQSNSSRPTERNTARLFARGKLLLLALALMLSCAGTAGAANRKKTAEPPEGETLSTETPDETPLIVLPEKLYAVAGHEFNLYFDNVILCPNLQNYCVKCFVEDLTGYRQMARFWRLTPAEWMTGEYTFTLTLFEKMALRPVASKTVTLVILPDTPPADKTVLFIGDSLTENGVYAAEIQENLSRGGIVSVGTVESEAVIGERTYRVFTEGRNAWCVSNYADAVDHHTDLPNPFLNPRTETFDFAYYLRKTRVTPPDIVCINLGTNDVGAYRTDIPKLQAMVESIHDYDPALPVLISLIPPGASQDGFGWMGSSLTADEFHCFACKRNQLVIETFDGKDPYTGVSAPSLFLDTVYDYPTATEPASARNPQPVTVQCETVHPLESGYLHLADAYYNALLFWLQSPQGPDSVSEETD